ncbi:MAG TPA: adenylosuccinate lyase, partial [Pelagibacterales bacterium]|nr:adenylosuccinate lyase [Pelagibacterales bacterium]
MTNISPLDNRYKKHVSELNEYFSEQALMKFRLYVEVNYLIFLSQHRALKNIVSLDKKDQQKLEKIYSNFDQKEYNEVKRIETKTKHDVSAVIQYLSKKVEKNVSRALVPWVHFGLTSEDINSAAYSLMIKEAVQSSMLKTLEKLSGALKKLVSQNKGFPMLALTHGQPATTTTLGKEMAVFHARLSRQIKQLKKHELLAKFSGATGTLAAHKVAFPKETWVSFSEKFIKTLGLKNNPITTQIEPNDSLAELLQNIIRINN